MRTSFVTALTLLPAICLAQAPETTFDRNLTSTCPQGYSPTYIYGNASVPNASLKQVWAYMGQWGNKTWANQDIVWVSDNGTEPGALRNFSFGNGDQPQTEQLVWRFGSDASNVPFAPVVSIGFRGTYRNVGKSNATSANELTTWWASQPIHSSATDPGLDVPDGVVIGFNIYACATNTSIYSTAFYRTNHQEMQNVVDYFSGNGVTVGANKTTITHAISVPASTPALARRTVTLGGH